MSELRIGKHTPEDLAWVLDLIPVLEQERRAFQAKIASEPQSFAETFLTSGFTWAHLYEYPFRQFLIASQTVAGLTEAVLAVSQAEQPVSRLQALLEDDAQDWEGGTGGQFKLGDLLGYLRALLGNLDSVLLYGLYLNELIGQAQQGDLPALLQAIRIDPTVLTGPTAQIILSVAVIEGDKATLKAIRDALAGKTGKQARYLKRFRMLMQILHEADALDRPTRELRKLAIQLGAYENQPGADKNVDELIRKARKLHAISK